MLSCMLIFFFLRILCMVCEMFLFLWWIRCEFFLMIVILELKCWYIWLNLSLM